MRCWHWTTGFLRRAGTRQRGVDSARCWGSSRRFAHPLRQRHAVDYVQPGVALVADAAHTIHPLAGQGINLGLQDVAVLAEEFWRGTPVVSVRGSWSCCAATSAGARART